MQRFDLRSPEFPDKGIIPKKYTGFGEDISPPFIRKAHRYRFTAFALDTMLDISSKSNKKQLLQAMSGHIVDKADLTGICYQYGVRKLLVYRPNKVTFQAIPDFWLFFMKKLFKRRCVFVDNHSVFPR